MSLARAGALGLGLLMAVAPFEPRRPLLAVAGLQFTLLELIAGLVLAVLLAAAASGPRGLAARGPLLGLAALAGAHVLSVAAAPGASYRPALRMAVAALFAFAVSRASTDARRAGLVGLAAGSLTVAVLALAEIATGPSLDPGLDLFRATRSVVGDVRRATAGSEHPNLAAGFLAAGLVAAAGLWPPRRRTGWVVVFAALGSLGLAATASRGGLLSAVAGLAVLAVALRRGAGVSARWALGTVIAVVLGVALSGSAFGVRLGGEGMDRWYDARYQCGLTALDLRAGETRTIELTLTNTGRRGWAGDGSFRLGYHWYDLDTARMVADSFALPVARALAPGESVTLAAPVAAPAQAGQYLLVWDVFQVHAGWLSEAGLATAALSVRISAEGSVPPAGPPAVSAPPLAGAVPWRPDRRQLWALALRLWRERPLTGVGSDQFRFRYGPLAGRPDADTRVFANSLFLETAATTGAVGLLSLLFLLGSAAIATLRAGRSATDEEAVRRAATFLALLAALTAHGLVDYLQFFTGHYLLLGFVTGGAAAEGARALAPPSP